MKITKNSKPARLGKIKQRPRNWDKIFKKPTREEYTEFIVDLARNKNLSGTLVECGVGRGKSLATFAHYLPDDVVIWGFDSFEGFPDVSPVDKHNKKVQKGYIKCDLDDTRKVLEEYNNEIKLEKGFFEESLSRYDGSPIMILHLDCDLYNSYKICLSTLYDKVVSGGIIMFDEYCREYWAYGKWAGAVLAIDEFFEDKSFNPRYYPDFGGKAYMVKGE